MEAVARTVDAAELAALLAAPDAGIRDTVFRVTAFGAARPVVMKVLAQAAGGARGAPLIFTFHGFVDQAKRGLPVFDGAHVANRLLAAATIVAIADSTLEGSPRMNVGWYLGSADFDLPAQLAALFDSLVADLAPAPLIFFGGSTGAYPCLWHGHRFADSLCITANPLARVSGFHQKMVDLCLRAGWPGLTRDQVLGPLRPDDVAAAYATGYSNRVLVLQNASDHYFRGPVLGLLNALAAEPRFMLISEFFPDNIGHTYPLEPILTWLEAAVTAGSGELADIARRAHGLRRAAAPPAPAKAPGRRPAIDPRDEAIARLLSSSA